MSSQVYSHYSTVAQSTDSNLIYKQFYIFRSFCCFYKIIVLDLQVEKEN